MKDTIKYVIIIGVCYAVFAWGFPLLGLFGGSSAAIQRIQRDFDDYRERSESHTAGLETSLAAAKQELSNAERDADSYRELQATNQSLRADNARLGSLLSEAYSGAKAAGEPIRSAIRRAERIERLAGELREQEHQDTEGAGDGATVLADGSNN